MKNFLTFILAIILLSSCAEEDPSPTIIEGTLVWDDGTPATSILILIAGTDHRGFSLFPNSKGTDLTTLTVNDNNDFYLELDANKDVDSYTLNFLRVLSDGSYGRITDSASISCGDKSCLQIAPGHHYTWEIILPRVP
uniref:hypothetical protein n=1 Tax=Roseivirga sp. TaxID=1964215 RepID=UPI004047F7B7